MTWIATLGTLPPAPAPAQATTPHRPPRVAPGPVMMGDIQAQWGGEALLLHLWRRWEDPQGG